MAIVDDAVVQLSLYPPKFDDTALTFFPSSWSRQLSKVLNKNQSESGKDLIQTIRAKKRSYPFSFALADDTWCDFFEQYYEKDSFILSIYSTRTHAYETATVRMEGLTITPRKHSQDLTEVTGVWDVSFTLEEF